MAWREKRYGNRALATAPAGCCGILPPQYSPSISCRTRNAWRCHARSQALWTPRTGFSVMRPRGSPFFHFMIFLLNGGGPAGSCFRAAGRPPCAHFPAPGEGAAHAIAPRSCFNAAPARRIFTVPRPYPRRNPLQALMRICLWQHNFPPWQGPLSRQLHRERACHPRFSFRETLSEGPWHP